MKVGARIGLPIGKATRNAFGEALRDLGHEYPNIVVVDGDVHNSTRTGYFAKEFPDRFFNLGIAESNMVGVAAGLAASGKIAFVSSFACFIMCNAFDQLRMSVAFPRQNVKVVGSHAGISIGEDGPSQMGIEDVALALALPGFAVFSPADEHAARALTRHMVETEGPAYMRTGRPDFPVVYQPESEFVVGRANRLRDGGDLTIVASGLMVAAGLEAAYLLSQDGIEARVLDMHTIRPLDEEAIEAAARETGCIVTAEEHLLAGGMGQQVATVAARTHPVPMGFVGLDNTYATSGSTDALLERYGLTADHIAQKAREALSHKQRPR
ncbi:MAG: transketolase family protein [Anaerolineae bacterium]|nr:transketolase family protein [Anaerolineae bacterium]